MTRRMRSSYWGVAAVAVGLSSAACTPPPEAVALPPAPSSAPVVPRVGPEADVVAAYEAYWDAVYAAADPGGGRVADPDHPGLDDVMAQPQLADWRVALTELRDAGRVLRGRPRTAPVVVGMRDGDTAAVVNDCVTEVDGAGERDAATGDPVGPSPAGRRTLDETRLRLDGGRWVVTDWDIGVEGTCGA